MKVADILGLLGGLALFLYGMQMMSSGLEAAAGNRMKRILETSDLQSLLGVGSRGGNHHGDSVFLRHYSYGGRFCQFRMMTLSQAVWITMGANIGTTITGQLIALDVGLWPPSSLSAAWPWLCS